MVDEIFVVAFFPLDVCARVCEMRLSPPPPPLVKHETGVSDAALRPYCSFCFLEPGFTTADYDDLYCQNLIMHCSGFFSSGCGQRRRAHDASQSR